MNQISDNIKIKSHELYEQLKTERDELRLQLHLMKAEIKDEWGEIERKWSKYESKSLTIKNESSEEASDLTLGFSALGHEIKEVYKEIKAKIKSSKLIK